MRIGLDFDNTLISYDALFYRIAQERDLVPVDLPQQKKAVRDHLRSQGQEDIWTEMQGEVYGVRITEAEPFPEVFAALKALGQADVPLRIVSHKTKTPYRGPAYDLHQAARNWLTQQGFFDPAGLGWATEQVFFEVTKEEKCQRIVDLGCSHYVDDLPEILEMLPDSIQKILFAPAGAVTVPSGWLQLHNWQDFPGLVGANA